MARTLKQLKETRNKRRIASKMPRADIQQVAQNLFPEQDAADDFVPPPSTPPAMDPVTVCPFAPVKPKTVQDRYAEWVKTVDPDDYCTLCYKHWTYCKCNSDY
jgi:hypothetical protein